MDDDLKHLADGLRDELSSLKNVREELERKQDEQYRELHNYLKGKDGEDDGLLKTVEEQGSKYADMFVQLQATNEAVEHLSQQLDTPGMSGTEKDMAEKDRETAVEMQRRAWLHSHENDDDFRPDMDNLVNLKDMRSATRKLMKVGLESKESIVRSFTEAETKAFEASTMDMAFFMPEMLGMELDCNPECAYLLDLYGQANVSRSTFRYPHIIDYGAIGQYDCDAKCDAELGPEGNITYKNGRTYDFRGVFCFNRKVLTEANYDLLGFMVEGMQRSYRINRNNALIAGDGVNEPLGWLTAECFESRMTNSAGAFDHRDYRMFIMTAPMEFGDVVAVMHQNVLAWLATKVDNNGRFIFADGDLLFSPNVVRNSIRISNCLPDPTQGMTVSDGSWTAGDFIMAAANWNNAYKAVTKRPMFLEQYEGGSTAWCVKYQFGAEDGGFTHCCEAGRTLVVQ